MCQHSDKAIFLWPLLVLISSTCQAAPLYEITTLGLTDSEHTRNDGYKYNYVITNPSSLNEVGQVIGGTHRYIGGSIYMGTSAWIFDGSNTVKVGLNDGVYTRSDGYQEVYASHLNESGKVVGSSSRYDGLDDMGRSVWLYDGSTTIELGLTDINHTRTDGYRNNTDIQLNEAGTVLGDAERFDGMNNMGRSVWLYDGSSTIEIGIAGGEHIRSDGYQYTFAYQLNEAGQVIGGAERYNGLNNMGRSVWVYDGSTTIEIGLSGGVHTRSDGYQSNWAYRINEAGYVAGYAHRFGSGGGQSAWVYDGNTTIEIGLTGGIHTGSDGYQHNAASQVNESGKVTGTARRTDGTIDMGWSAWIYDGKTTIEIGLSGDVHTRSDGYQLNSFGLGGLNNAGQTVGYTHRYDGMADLGQSTWFYDGINTFEIGLSGGAHTRSDGYQSNSTRELNEAGQVTGSAKRYDGLTQKGETVWFYDAQLDQIFSNDFSITSEGYAYSIGQYLGEDGLMLGYYELFDTDDTLLGNRAFSFTVDDGFLDLDIMVDGLDISGWAFLAQAYESNGIGQILGEGELDGIPGQAVYLLTPQVSAVPIPPSVWLFGSGLIGLIGVAGRKKS